ncbi:reverse transcriptase [Tanacetum coccineum]
MKRDAKSRAKTLLAMQFKKGFNKSEPCYLLVTRLVTDEGSSKMEVPKVIERVLDEFKDVMPKEFPKKLPPRRELDHTIELEMGSKPPAKAPYRMPLPELEELRNQLKELIDTGYSRPSKAPYDDIVVYSHTLEEHVLHLKQVFQVLRDNELYVKLEKCSFTEDEVEFLGHKIKDGGLMMDGAKIKAI